MNVSLIGWSDADAVAQVDGTRVRIRRNRSATRWLCDEHGEGVNNPDLCAHTRALAAAPADPARRNRARTTDNPHSPTTERNPLP